MEFADKNSIGPLFVALRTTYKSGPMEWSQ